MAEDEEGEGEAALVDISGHIDHPIYERKDFTVRVLQPAVDGSPAADWSGHIKKYMATKTLYNVKDLDEEDFSAEMDARPNTEWYWCVGFYCPYLPSDDNIRVTLFATLTYYVTLSEPIGAPISGTV